MYKKLILLGAPGSGKGTIGKYIERDFKYRTISTGDILRKSNDEQVKKIIQRGELVSDDMLNKIVKNEVTTLTSNTILDGYPRTVNQAEYLDSIDKIDYVLHIDVPFEEIMERLTKRFIHQASGRTYHLTFSPPKNGLTDDETGEPLTQREDDKEEVVKARLEKYAVTTQPLIEFYSKKNKLASFKGLTSPEIYKLVQPFIEQNNLF